MSYPVLERRAQFAFCICSHAASVSTPPVPILENHSDLPATEQQ